MTREMNTDAIEKGTGKPWSEWLEFLESIDAHKLAHGDIARRVHEHGSPGWWAQTITVAYEQHIGRRIPGQDSNGEFSVAVSKTIDGTMDDALDIWVHLVGGKDVFADVPVASRGEISKTEKWRYWRITLADDTRLVVTTTEKSPGKASLTVTHEKLPSAAAVEQWRAYWRKFLGDL